MRPSVGPVAAGAGAGLRARHRTRLRRFVFALSRVFVPFLSAPSLPLIVLLRPSPSFPPSLPPSGRARFVPRSLSLPPSLPSSGRGAAPPSLCVFLWCPSSRLLRRARPFVMLRCGQRPSRLRKRCAFSSSRVKPTTNSTVSCLPAGVCVCTCLCVRVYCLCVSV